MNTHTISLIEALQLLDYHCAMWNLEGEETIQITSFETGPAHGMTVYVSAEATLERAIELIGNKRHQFAAMNAGKEA